MLHLIYSKKSGHPPFSLRPWPPASGRQQSSSRLRGGAWSVEAISCLLPLATAPPTTAHPTEEIAAGIIPLVGVLLHFSFADASPRAVVTRGVGSADEAEDGSLFAHHQPRQAECDVPYRQ